MPQLPTLTVTDVQAARIIAAFGTVEAYKEWLKERLINHVLDVEDQAENQAYAEKREADRAEFKASIT